MPNRELVVSARDGHTALEATVHFPDGSVAQPWMRSEDVEHDSSDLTSWMIATLPLAMRLRAHLRLEGNVDEAALENVARAQEVLARWFPRELSRIEITSEGRLTGTPAGGSGAFFSGGVDSFFTAQTATPPLDVLIFVGGFDIPWDAAPRLEFAWNGTRAAAEEFGARAIRVDSNIRELTDPYLHWGYVAHGAALAGVSYALRRHVSDVRVASSYNTEQLHPWGTHPELDPYWSSSVQRLRHDSTTETRAEKVASIMSAASARAALRVCWQGATEGNCGVCEKCVRTRVNLRASGHDGACETLPPLDLADLRRLPLSDPSERLFAEENLAYILDNAVQDPSLQQALEDAIRRGIRREHIAKAARASVFKLPGARRLADLLRGR
ncbi:hypothetical protein [Microbacterium yannicii]|uniref:hypothetical protein n=1 Tax=Microbacterium yannicii TaxID=671622 RepID=UPI0012F8BBED|nr:hypothetical protein [Microbacterium yannicii]